MAGAALIGIGATWVSYRHDMRIVAERMAGQSQLVATRHGSIEYAAWGSGPAVLALHGAGGGHDQGSLLARALGGEGFRWIVPSRFGYLRSNLPADASTAAQADAIADLLDALQIERVAILAMSGGVPPALQFARRHPARTAALVLLSSAPYTPLQAEAQELPVPAWVYQAIFSSDFPYWVLNRLARARIETLFDVTPATRAAMRPEEARFLAGMVDTFQPVSQRIDGLRNEVAAVDPRADYALDRISTPTLVVHAWDDGINPFAFGEYTAAQVRGAEFMPLPSGGHLLLGRHADVRARANAFLRRHHVGGMPEEAGK